jgi:Mg2+/Co2+ transporter CorC
MLTVDELMEKIMALSDDEWDQFDELYLDMRVERKRQFLLNACEEAVRIKKENKFFSTYDIDELFAWLNN